MFKYIFFVIGLFISNFAFAEDVMVNLTKHQAEEAMSYLKGEKAVIIRESSYFNYFRIRSLKIIHGVAKTSTLDKFSILHQDGDDYYIELNGQPVDLEYIYLKSKEEENKWVRLGSKVVPSFYSSRENETYYVYKGGEKLPEECSKQDFEFVAPIKTPKVSGDNNMILEEDEADREFNNGQVFKKLRQVDC